jgi:hypothetical protein
MIRIDSYDHRLEKDLKKSRTLTKGGGLSLL